MHALLRSSNVLVLLTALGAALALTQSRTPSSDLTRAKASAESFLADRGIVGGVRYFRDRKPQDRGEPTVDFLTEKTWPGRFNSPLKLSVEVGVITGDIKSYSGPRPVASGGKDLTRQQLEGIVRRIARQRGVELYETVRFDIFPAGDERLDRSKPEGLAFFFLREKDSGAYPVLDFGNHVVVQVGLKTGSIQSYSETRGFVKGRAPTSMITAEAAKRIAVQRFRNRGVNPQVIDARLGWVVPDRPAKSKLAGKLEYEFAWDVRIARGPQVRVRASDGVVLGQWVWESTFAGSREVRERVRLSRPPR